MSILDCGHEHSEVRFKTNAAGVRMYRRQCLACGVGLGNFLPHDSKTEISEPWDDNLESSWRDLMRRARAEQWWSDEGEDWYAKYTAYITTSPVWQSKRKRVLKRDNYICRACLVRKATQVHHKHYHTLFNEPLFDLESICDICHGHLHDKVKCAEQVKVALAVAESYTREPPE